jgi:hypothetical protein
LHEFGHHRDIAFRGWWRSGRNATAEEEANDTLYHEDQATDHTFRINQFLHPKSRLLEDRLIQDRANVLWANDRLYPANSYIEQMIENPDVIAERRRYMSLREPRGSMDWLLRILESSARRAVLIRLLMAKLAAARGL